MIKKGSKILVYTRFLFSFEKEKVWHRQGKNPAIQKEGGNLLAT